MSEREIAWTPERQATLQDALDGEVHFFNPGGLGGSYLRRGAFVYGPDDRHPVRLLVMAQALVHGEHIMVGSQGRRRLRVTSKGVDLLAKWRARRG
jgi:hypothetical protein